MCSVRTGTGSVTVHQRAGTPAVHGAGGDGAAGQEQAGATEDDSPRLTVAALARRLGVAPATLRTWDRRYGLGPSDHTSGRHRRYGPTDVARLERMQEALLRGASPSEAARYAHATPVDETASGSASTGARGGASEPASTHSAPGRFGSPEEASDGEAVLVSGVLDGSDSGSVRPAPRANRGGGGLRLGEAGDRARGLGRAVQSLDSRGVQRLLVEAAREDGVVAMRRDVLQPVLRALTERRERSGSGVEMSRLLTDCALTALRSVVVDAEPPANPRPVLLSSVPGEPQELDLVAFAAALADNGVGHRLFAPALPKEGLDAAIRRAAPAAVVVWAQRPYYADPDVFVDLPNPRQRVRAFAGGPGWRSGMVPTHVETLDSWESSVERVTATVLARRGSAGPDRDL